MRAPIEYSVTPGDPSQVLLLVHGDFSTGRGAWRRQLETLGTRLRLIAVDRRGHGASPPDPEGYTFAQDAADLRDVLNAERIDSVHLVGHSYGAVVAIEFASTWPEAVRTLHLIEPPYLSLALDHPAVASLAEATQRLQTSGGLSDEALTEAFFRMVLGDAAAEALMAKPAWDGLVQEADRFRREEFVGAYPPERLRRLPGSLRVTLYSGGRSHPALQEVAKRLASSLPGARLHLFPEAGHDVQRIGEPFDAALLAAIGEV